MQSQWRSTLYSWTALVILSSVCRAQGFVEHVEPPVLERGKTTRVTVVGTHLGKAQDLWTSLPGGTVKATLVGVPTSTRAVLDVSVATSAPVGVCGVRLATADGLANACMMLIDDLPVRSAVDSAKVKLPAALWGRFRDAGVDRFAIDVRAGQRVSFEAVANRFGKDVDPLVTIRDAKGRIVLQRDNDPGLYFDCRFEHTFTEAGTYTVEMRDARYHGSAHGFYVLRMGRFPGTRVAIPMVVCPGKRAELRLPDFVEFLVPKDAAGLFFGVVKLPNDEGSAWLPLEASDADVTIHKAPGNTIDEGTLAKLPGNLCGVLQTPGERHFYRLELAKGQKIQVRADARAFNSPADLELTITDAKGKELRRATENVQKEEVVLDFNAGSPGVYGLTVRDIHRDGGPAFAYRLDVRTSQPRIQVNADIEGLTLPRGDYQPVPLNVTRTDYVGKIALKLAGAPPGVTLTPNEIDTDRNTVVCKLSATTDAPIGIHTLQILATGDGMRPVAVSTRPLIDRQIVNVDLIPHALREDQRRLPPSLTDRLAVQITPPAPFTFELPEAQVTLGRYQQVDYLITVKRINGFNGPIHYRAKGGQIAPKEEGRTRVYAEFAEGKGSIHSKILTNLAKHRVDVTAVGEHEGRSVTLTRTFDLEIRSAFAVSAEPSLQKAAPGDVAKIRLNADRMKTFQNDVIVQLSPTLGLSLPERIVIPRGQDGVDVAIMIAPDRPPGRQNISFTATAIVNGFEEEQRGRFEIEMMKVAVQKK